MEVDLDAIEARANAATDGPWFWRNTQGRSGDVYLQGARTRIVMAFKRMGMNGAQPMFRGLDGLLYESADVNINQFPDAEFIAHARTDVPALVAEVRSLRTHLAHAAEVEAALTSDLLAAHVEVEQLRVTRATDRNRGMTDLDLDAIEARANAAMLSPTGQQYDAGVVLSTDVPALVAEVRRLREWGTVRDYERLTAERDEARVAIARVRALHTQRLGCCRECCPKGIDAGPHVEYPCATIRALDGAS